MFFLLYKQTTTQTQTAVKKRAMKDMENTPLTCRSQMQFFMNFMSGVFSSKTPMSI